MGNVNKAATFGKVPFRFSQAIMLKRLLRRVMEIFVSLSTIITT